MSTLPVNFGPARSGVTSLTLSEIRPLSPSAYACEPQHVLSTQGSSSAHQKLRAWGMLGRMKIVEGLSIIQNLLDSHEPQDRDLTLLKAAALAISDEADVCDALARQTLHGSDHPGHAIAALLVRLGHWKRREIHAFGNLSRPSTATSPRRREALINILHLSIESAVEAEQLRLSSASRLARQALALSNDAFGHDFPGSRFAAALEARLLYEQDRIDDADRLIRDRLALTGVQGGIEGALASYVLGARIAVVRRQNAFAVLLLREAEELGRERNWVRLIAVSLAERVRILLDSDRQEDAIDCLRRLEAMSSMRSTTENELHISRQIALARARATLHSGTTEATVKTLQHMIAGCTQRDERRMAVEVRGLLGCVLFALGRTDEAHVEAACSFRTGAAAGLYRTFLDEGPTMLALLTSLDRATVDEAGLVGELRPYLRSLIAAFPERTGQETSARQRHRSGDTLSPRERHIIKLISHGLSNKRIAKELGIAPETVKSHAKHILLKLAAQTRVEAVSRAVSLGIL